MNQTSHPGRGNLPLRFFKGLCTLLKLLLVGQFRLRRRGRGLQGLHVVFGETVLAPQRPETQAPAGPLPPPKPDDRAAPQAPGAGPAGAQSPRHDAGAAASDFRHDAQPIVAEASLSDFHQVAGEARAR